MNILNKIKNIEIEFYLYKIKIKRIKLGSAIYEMRIYYWIDLYFFGLAYGRNCRNSDFKN